MTRRRIERPVPSDAVGFRVERSGGPCGDNFVPVIVYANGGEFRHASCVCLDQAACTATRCGTRPIPFLGMQRLRAGELVDVAPDLACPVDRSSWTWPHHGHTHGTLARLTARSAP